MDREIFTAFADGDGELFEVWIDSCFDGAPIIFFLPVDADLFDDGWGDTVWPGGGGGKVETWWDPCCWDALGDEWEEVVWDGYFEGCWFWCWHFEDLRICLDVQLREIELRKEFEKMDEVEIDESFMKTCICGCGYLVHGCHVRASRGVAQCDEWEIEKSTGIW